MMRDIYIKFSERVKNDIDVVKEGKITYKRNSVHFEIERKQIGGVRADTNEMAAQTVDISCSLIKNDTFRSWDEAVKNRKMTKEECKFKKQHYVLYPILFARLSESREGYDEYMTGYVEYIPLERKTY